MSGVKGEVTGDAERWAPLRLGKYAQRALDEIELACL